MSCHKCNTNPCCCNGVPFAPPIVPIPAPPGLPVCPTACPEPAPADESVARVFECIECFAVPAVGSNIDVSILDAEDWLKNCCVIVKDDTQSVIMRIDQVNSTLNTLTLHNGGYEGNPPGGTPLAGTCKIMMIGPCPAGSSEVDCIEGSTTTFEAFNIPAVGAGNVNIKLNDCLGVEPTQRLFVQAIGVVEVVSVVATVPEFEVEIFTVCLLDPADAGSIVPSGSFVVDSETCVEHGRGLEYLNVLRLSSVSSFSADNADSAVAYAVGDGADPASGDQIPMTNEVHDVTSDYDDTTSEFTAPVDGIYSLDVHTELDNGYVNDDYELVLVKNATDVLVGLTAGPRANTGTVHGPMNSHFQIQLDASDVLQVKIAGLTTFPANVNLNVTHWVGHLIQEI